MSLFSSSINGLQAALNNQSVRANNVANVNSRGFKARNPIQHPQGKDGIALSSPANFSQGSLTATGQTGDVALNGPGFFVLQDANGEHRYTRSLSLRLDADGSLVDQNSGLPVAGLRGNANNQGEVGNPGGITDMRTLRVERDGTMYVLGSSGERREVGKLLTANFSNPQSLTSLEGGAYGASGETGQPFPAKAQVVQGAREESNTDLATEMTGQMINEAGVKANVQAIKTQDQMLGDLLDLKG